MLCVISQPNFKKWRKTIFQLWTFVLWKVFFFSKTFPVVGAEPCGIICRGENEPVVGLGPACSITWSEKRRMSDKTWESHACPLFMSSAKMAHVNPVSRRIFQAAFFRDSHLSSLLSVLSSHFPKLVSLGNFCPVSFEGCWFLQNLLVNCKSNVGALKRGLFANSFFKKENEFLDHLLVLLRGSLMTCVPCAAFSSQLKTAHAISDNMSFRWLHRKQAESLEAGMISKDWRIVIVGCMCVSWLWLSSALVRVSAFGFVRSV